MLDGGGHALDAAETAVAALEDDPAFNAGTGAVLRADGSAVLDAMIMDGATLTAGGVALVRRLANPVRAARDTRGRSRHRLGRGTGGRWNASPG